MKKFEVTNHEPSFLPDGNWKLVWADEFDGTELDRTKWNFRLNFWGKRFDAYTEEGIVFDGDSHIELHRVEKDGYYVSPQLQTGANSFDAPKDSEGIWPIGTIDSPKFEHRYGYYECRCKFPKEPDVMWSAFWLQSPSIGMTYDPKWCGIENDIMENFFVGKASTGNIYGGFGQQYVDEGRVYYDLKNTDDGWHYFGMDWRPDGYTFYCDGQEISRANEKVSSVPQFILLTTEIRGYRAGTPLKVGEHSVEYENISIGKIEKIRDEFIDDAFIVDFVRVFDRVENNE